MKYDVIFVGSGISSLVGAALLAKTGRRVLVLEKHSKPGGYLHCFHRWGARFDTGAHYVGASFPGQAFHSILSYLGLDPEGYFLPLEKDGFDIIQFPEFEFRVPSGREALQSHLIHRFPREEAGIRHLLALINETAMNFPTYGMRANPDFQLLNWALQTPLSEVLKKLISDPQLSAFFKSYCVHHGVRPNDISFGLHAVMFDSFVSGASGLKGGGDRLAEALVERIETLGGEVRLKSEVDRFYFSRNEIESVQIKSGERFSGEWVISGIHPKATFALVDSSFLTPAFSGRLNKMRESIGLFGLYLVLKTPDMLDRRRNYFFHSSLAIEDMWAEKGHDALPSMVFMSPSDREGLENNMAVNIHAVAPMSWFGDFRNSKYGQRPKEYHETKDEISKRILQLIEIYKPGFQSDIVHQLTSTPLTNEHFNGAVDGSAYGIYHDISSTGARALGPRTHVPNLLLTGQNTLFPGLLGAAISGLRSAAQINGMKPMIRDLEAFR